MKASPVPPSLRGLGLGAALLVLPLIAPAADDPIGPEVRSILEEMSGRLAGAEAMAFSATRTLGASRLRGSDEPQSVEVSTVVKRPDKIKVTVDGLSEDRDFYFDGKKMIVFDRKMMAYGEIDSEGSIDLAVEKIAAKHGFFPPLSDFIVSDPYKALMTDVTSANLLSNEEVAGEECFRVSFTQEDKEWELWVAKSDHLPRKIIVNVVGAAGNPALEATISDWNLQAVVEDASFEFAPPEGAENVKHRSVNEAEADDGN